MQGFATMELAGAFRLGGDPETAFARGLDAVLPQGVPPTVGHASLPRCATLQSALTRCGILKPTVIRDEAERGRAGR